MDIRWKNTPPKLNLNSEGARETGALSKLAAFQNLEIPTSPLYHGLGMPPWLRVMISASMTMIRS